MKVIWELSRLEHGLDIFYWRQERYADAEAIWEDVVKKHHYEEAKRTDGEHLDRGKWYLFCLL